MQQKGMTAAEEARARRYVLGLFRAYRSGDGLLPPPWVVAEPDETGAMFVGVYPAPLSPGGEEQPWLVRGFLADAGESLVLAQLGVEHGGDETVELSAYAFRRLPVAAVRDRALEWLRSKHRSVTRLKERYPYTDEEVEWARQAAAKAKGRPQKRGRRGYDVDHYRRIAIRAVDLHASRRRDVLRTLAKEEKRPYQTVRDWIHKARHELEFLEPVKQGRTEFLPGTNLYKKGDSNG